jgi:hypothetical protein
LIVVVQVSDPRQSRQNGIYLRKVCGTFFDAVFKSVSHYPLYALPRSIISLVRSSLSSPGVDMACRECRLYLRDVLSRTGQYYCKKRERKERKQEAKREREVQRAEKIRLYSAQAAAKQFGSAGSSGGATIDAGMGLEFCGSNVEELINGMTLSDEDEREASLNVSAGEADANKDEDEDEGERSDIREEEKIDNMLPVLAHLGFKKVWSAFTMPEEFELLPYGSLEYALPPSLRFQLGLQANVAV